MSFLPDRSAVGRRHDPEIESLHDATSGNSFRFLLAGLLGALLLVSGCASPFGFFSGRSHEPVGVARTHALLLNGGASKALNYASHLEHLEGVLEVLETSGVPPADITIFSSDGEDPRPDLATRASSPNTGLTHPRFARQPIRYRNTSIPGYELEPATKAALETYFAETASRFPAGSTLFLYVTDHGTRGEKGPRSNRISLWNNQDLTVAELEEMLAGLPPGVRVVFLMSQCFSGGFAFVEMDRGAGAETCGYFSTTPDRLAYGCYPEHRADAGVGHSMRFLDGLRAGLPLAQAHSRVLQTDRTPDVPLRTSDLQYEVLLRAVAEARGQQEVEVVDELLGQAWQSPERYESSIRELDRVGSAFGVASPRQLSELRARLEILPEVRAPLDKHAEAWDEARADAGSALLRRFGADHPDLGARLNSKKKLSPAEARALQQEFLEVFPGWFAEDGSEERLETLVARSGIARNISSRMEVREAALLRLEFLLVRVAGEEYLRAAGSSEEKARFAALLACEDFALPIAAEKRRPLPPRKPYPSYDGDIALARQVLPAWMGIQFRPVDKPTRQKYDLPPGAVQVRHVYEGSPAEAAGLLVGDLILGPPGEPFLEPRQIREWTMFQSAGVARPLRVVREGIPMEIVLTPGAHPGAFPALPQPPAVGEPAPALSLVPYRGVLPEIRAGHGRHLLFFWATWCAPCKAALPKLLAWSERTGIPIVAITDESADRLDAFFAEADEGYPEIIARDPMRQATLAFGVSGTPTFVLLDDAGRVETFVTGYAAERPWPLPVR